MTYTSLPTTFRDNLLAAIRKDGRPVKAIASVSGYSESHIRRVINGDKPNPTLRVVEALADALGVSPTDLMGERP